MALQTQSDLENMLAQGAEFYGRLIDHLTMMKQNVQDYKMSRNMQMGDVCKQNGMQPPDFNASGPAMPPPMAAAAAN